MGVDVPTAAALSIIDEQKTWDQSRKSRSTKEFLHKRYSYMYTNTKLIVLALFLFAIIIETSGKKQRPQDMRRRRFIWNNFAVLVP